jgi:putative ABC transport system substrate-binding protein
MTLRREFITMIGGAAAWPLAARAQRQDQTKRVAVLHGTGEAEFWRLFPPFRDQLSQLGWAEPRNLRIDYRWTDNRPDLAQEYARELVNLAPDVIVAIPGPAAEVLQRLTHTIPIVFSTSTDPVQAGYAESYARPGGNMTGFTQFENTLNTKFLQLIKNVAPHTSRVAVLNFTPGLARARRDLPTVEGVARSLGISPVAMLVQDDAGDIERAIVAFSREPNGALIVPPDNRAEKYRGLIAALAAQHQLPAISSNRILADAGGLMSYGSDQGEIYRQVASYVDRILRGTKPSDLPIQAPTRFQFVINLRTAKALGLDVPATLLAIADEIIE